MKKLSMQGTLLMGEGPNRQMEPVQNKYLSFVLIFITVELLDLTNHDPLIKRTIGCQRKNITH